METLSPTAPLFASFVHDLARYIVPIVVAELKTQTNAEGMGMIALDPNNLALPVYTLMQHDDNIRDVIASLIEDQYASDLRSMGTKLDKLDNKVDDMESKLDDIDIDDMKGEIATLEEKVGELEENSTPIDADDSEFAGAVMAVLRKNI
jgi:hypothetical protein